MGKDRGRAMQAENNGVMTTLGELQILTLLFSLSTFPLEIAKDIAQKVKRRREKATKIIYKFSNSYSI